MWQLILKVDDGWQRLQICMSIFMACKHQQVWGWFELENRPGIVAVPAYDSRLLFELLHFGIRTSSATSGSSRHTAVEDRFPLEEKIQA